MKKKFLINLALIGFSGVVLGYLLHIIDASGNKTFTEVLSETAEIVFSYWLGFGILTLLFRKRVIERIFGCGELLSISLIGSFLYVIFNIAENIKGDWEYISQHQNQFYTRHIEPHIFFFFVYFLAYFVISMSTTFIIKLVRRLTISGHSP